MRRWIYVLSVILVLLVLSSRPVKAACDWDSVYQVCSGTCNSGYTCKLTAPETCGCVANSTPQPTSVGGASPTATPTPPPCSCSGSRCNGAGCTYTYLGCNTTSCSTYPNYAKIHAKCGTKDCGGASGYYCGYSAECVAPNCSPNSPGCYEEDVPLDCNYNASGCNLCGVGRVKKIICNGVHCGDVCVSNSLCSGNQWCSGGGGGGPTDTPTPTAFLRLRLFNPQLTPFTIPNICVTYTPTPYRSPTPSPLYSPTPTPCGGKNGLPGVCPIISTTAQPTPTQPHFFNGYCYFPISLCKVNCGAAPCSNISCQNGSIDHFDFPGAAADQGGGLQYSSSYLTVLGITPIENGNLSTVNSYPGCRGSTTTKNCASWSTALSTGSRVLHYIVITNTPTPTPIPAYIKLKNTSFYTDRSLTNPIPANPVAYDSDDDGSRNFIIASLSSDPGLVSATSLNLGSGAPSVKGWKTTSLSNSALFTPSSFATYIRSRKNFTTLTSLSDIQAQNYNQQTLLFDGDLTLDDPTIFSNRSLVLIVNGNATLSYSGAFTPTNSSLAILSTGTINFSSTLTQAKGIFIASSIDTGSTSNQGLKIIGNLIALDSFVNNRRLINTSIPTVFIVFDKDQYLGVLPMLSTVNYQWSESN